MSSMTAQLSVGTPDRYHDGIRPTHVLWLRENDQAIWTLIEVHSQIYGDPDRAVDEPEPWATQPIRWGGNQPEQILRNGFLILALHVLRDEALIEQTMHSVPALLEVGRVDLSKVDPAALNALHELSMTADLPGKVVVSVMGGSTLEGQLPLLERYSTQLEVCTVTYSHTWGGFVGRSGAEPAGSLTASWSSQGPTPNRYRDINFPNALPGNLAERSAAAADGSGERMALRRWVEGREELLERGIIRTAEQQRRRGIRRAPSRTQSPSCPTRGSRYRRRSGSRRWHAGPSEGTPRPRQWARNALGYSRTRCRRPLPRTRRDHLQPRL